MSTKPIVERRQGKRVGHRMLCPHSHMHCAGREYRVLDECRFRFSLFGQYESATTLAAVLFALVQVPND